MTNTRRTDPQNKKRKGVTKLTLKEVEAEVRRLDAGSPENGETYRVSVALLSALVVGTGAGPIAEFTGYDRSEVEKWVENWKKAGVFRGRKVVCNWFDDGGGVAFILDGLVGLGLVGRAP